MVSSGGTNSNSSLSQVSLCSLNATLKMFNLHRKQGELRVNFSTHMWIRAWKLSRSDRHALSHVTTARHYAYHGIELLFRHY